MAMTGVLRAGFVQLRVLDMERALTHYGQRIGLDVVEKAADGRVYLKCADEFDRHSIVLREADRPGMDVFAFKVAEDADLDSFAERIVASGIDVDEVSAGEQPGVGRRIGFTIPSGHRIELYAEMALSDSAPPTQNPDIWWNDPRGMRARSFDPSGNRNEVFCGGHRFYPDHPTRVWTADQLGKGIFYYEKELNDRFLGVVT